MRDLTKIATLAVLSSNMPSSKDFRAIAKINAETVKKLEKTNAELEEINQGVRGLNLSIRQQNRALHDNNKTAKESLALQKYSVLEQDKERIYNRQKDISKHSLEQQSKFLREAFFKLKNELDVLENSEASNLKKYFSTEAIQATLKQHKISTKLTDDLFEKQLIQDSFDKVKEIRKNTVKKLTKADKSDIKLVTMIMSDDENDKLLDLNNKRKSINSGHDKNIKYLKETLDFSYILKTYPKIVIKIK